MTYSKLQCVQIYIQKETALAVSKSCSNMSLKATKQPQKEWKLCSIFFHNNQLGEIIISLESTANILETKYLIINNYN